MAHFSLRVAPQRAAPTSNHRLEEFIQCQRDVKEMSLFLEDDHGVVPECPACGLEGAYAGVTRFLMK
jgi:hypothetical protein